MGRRKKIRICTACGTREGVNPRSDLCFPCAMEKMREEIRQLQAKEGPMYEKWKDGLLKHLAEMGEGG